MSSSDVNHAGINDLIEDIKSEHRIDQFLEISTTVIVILSTIFLLFVIVSTTTDWLPWKTNIARMLGY